MKYFVIFLVLVGFTGIVAINPAFALCAYDPSNPHAPCDDTREFLVLDSSQMQIENINGIQYYVSESFELNSQLYDMVVLNDVSFTLPYTSDPPRHVYSDVVFSDESKETLSIIFDEPDFTMHVKPQAGLVGRFDGYHFLVSVNLKEISPLKQFKSGTAFNDIKCRSGLELVEKRTNSHPICVKGTSVKSLTLRNYILEYNGALGRYIPLDNVYIIFPQNATGNIPDSGVIPPVSVISLGINDTVSWINDSDRLIILSALDNSWNAGKIFPHNQINMKFNHTGQYKYLIDILEDNRRTLGEIIVLGDDVDSIPIEERLEMAQAILSQHFRNLPLVGIGAGNADNVLEVTIHEDELEKFPDANSHYKSIVQQIIPFDIPIRIDFGPYVQPQ